MYNIQIREQLKRMTLPTPLVSYPREKIEGEYKESYETEEQEKEATNRYFKLNPSCDKRAVHKFIVDYDGENTQVKSMKKFNNTQFNFCYWGYEGLFKTTNKQDIIEIGKFLHSFGGIELMRASIYLVMWDMKKCGMCVGSWGRMIEHYWDGIGEWLA